MYNIPSHKKDYLYKLILLINLKNIFRWDIIKFFYVKDTYKIWNDTELKIHAHTDGAQLARIV